MGDAHSDGADEGAGQIQGAHGDLKALALFAQPIGRGHADILKDHIAGVGQADAELILLLAGAHAGAAALDNKSGQALQPLGAVHVGKNHVAVPVAD